MACGDLSAAKNNAIYLNWILKQLPPEKINVNLSYTHKEREACSDSTCFSNRYSHRHRLSLSQSIQAHIALNNSNRQKFRLN